MSDFAAFIDDSGSPEPRAQGDFFVLSLVAVPVNQARVMSEAWWQVLADYTGCASIEQCVGFEFKASDTYKALRNLEQGKPAPQKYPEPFRNLSQDELRHLIDAVWDTIALGTYGQRNWDVTYLGVVIHKQSNWKRFAKWDLNAYKLAVRARNKKQVKESARRLSRQILDNALTYLLQRLQYLMQEKQGYCIVIGDENSFQRDLYEIHAQLPSGQAQYTKGKNLVNNIVFGSSHFNPGLQIADWVAFALNNWARGNSYLTARLQRIISKFRTRRGKVRGGGIVLIPDHYQWPPLP